MTKSHPSEGAMAWASESMDAFKWESPEERERLALELQRKKSRKKSNVRKARTCCRRNVAVKNDSDWVFVQEAKNPIRLGMQSKRDIMVAPPADMIEANVQKRKNNVPKVTRELGDTAFNRVFKRPLPHTYGRGNTRPVNNKNYMKTFNLKAAQNNEDHVFPSAIRAHVFHEKLHMNGFNVDETLDQIAEEGLECANLKQDKEEEIGVEEAEISSTAVQVSDLNFIENQPAVLDAKYMKDCVFGRPSKGRHQEPSMYEILSWPTAA